MAVPRTGRQHEQDVLDEDAQSVVAPLSAMMQAVAPTPPTLADAFRILCEAMAVQLEDDVPAQMHCDELQSWYQNGASNYAVCWRHAVLMLEGILGAPLRQ